MAENYKELYGNNSRFYGLPVLLNCRYLYDPMGKLGPIYLLLFAVFFFVDRNDNDKQENANYMNKKLPFTKHFRYTMRNDKHQNANFPPNTTQRKGSFYTQFRYPLYTLFTRTKRTTRLKFAQKLRTR